MIKLVKRLKGEEAMKETLAFDLIFPTMRYVLMPDSLIYSFRKCPLPSSTS